MAFIAAKNASIPVQWQWILARKHAAASGSRARHIHLYEHIIFVDEAGGECYGRTKFQQSVNQFSGDVMARKLTKSNAHFQRAVKRLPLGVASNFRYWGEERTIYVKRGVGARITDLDDNEYVDYRMGYGPAILGYAHPEVDQAAREGMEVGGVFALSTERELKVAERISKMVPAAELVRFSNSGTEAVMAGLRLARAYTGKDDYVILEGGYHGLFDAAMWYTPMDHWSQVGDPQVQPYSEGVPISTRSFAHFVQANDANQLEDVFKRHAHRIACLLIEPIMGNCLGIAAEPEYLRAARSLCDQHGRGAAHR